MQNDDLKVPSENMANLKALAEEKDRRDNKPKRKLNQSTRDILKCIIVLSVIAAVVGALLGVVNYATYVDADAAIISEIAGHYGVETSLVKKDDLRKINPSGAKSYISNCFVVLDGSESNGGSGGISAPAEVAAAVYRAVGSGAYGGTVELLVYVEDGVIKDITVFAQNETKGIGSRALEESHLANYIGVNLDEIEGFARAAEATKDGEVEFISGATKTSTAVNNALNAVVYAYKSYEAAV